MGHQRPESDLELLDIARVDLVSQALGDHLAELAPVVDQRTLLGLLGLPEREGTEPNRRGGDENRGDEVEPRRQTDADRTTHRLSHRHPAGGP